MKRTKSISITAFFLFFAWLCSLYGEALKVKFFYQKDCPVCKEIEHLDLPRLREKYGDKINIIKFDTGIEQNFVQLLADLDKAGITSNATAHISIGNKVLCGKNDIRSQIDEVIDHKLVVQVTGSEEKQQNNAPVKNIQSKMTIAVIICAGVIDGINPCVISALIFLMGVLAMSGISGRRLAVTGLCYCFGSFITYTLIGLGLLTVVRELSAFYGLRAIINNGIVVLLLIFAAVSIWDGIKFYKTHSGSNVILKLPRRLQVLIHRWMKKATSGHHLIIAAFFLGGAVTLVETLCTGQIYVPSLVYMMRQDNNFFRHLCLLIVYNLMFTLPVAGVFCLMLAGLKLRSTINLGKKSIVWSKFVMALFFIILVVLMIIF